MKKLLQKLGAIQSALKAPKNQYNSFGDYKYRSCEDILEAVKPLLREQNCTLTLSDHIEQVSDRYYIVATATLFDNEGEGQIENIAYAREAETRPKMDVAQITGTASTYARKYALNGLFLIDDTKDADTDAYTKTGQAPANDETPPPVICPKCGKVVKPIKKRGGKISSPAEILDGCGGICYDCYQAEKNGGDIMTAPADIKDGK